jgi:hypothetical protein
MPEVPSAVSFKQLSSLLKAAGSAAPAEDGSSGEPVSFDWAERINALLKEVEQSSAAASEGKTVDQVMALGSFRTHLMLGLQALKAAQI